MIVAAEEATIAATVAAVDTEEEAEEVLKPASTTKRVAATVAAVAATATMPMAEMAEEDTVSDSFSFLTSDPVCRRRRRRISRP